MCNKCAVTCPSKHTSTQRSCTKLKKDGNNINTQDRKTSINYMHHILTIWKNDTALCFQNKAKRQRERERVSSLICWSTLQMPTILGTEPSQSWEPHPSLLMNVRNPVSGTIVIASQQAAGRRQSWELKPGTPHVGRGCHDCKAKCLPLW